MSKNVDKCCIKASLLLHLEKTTFEKKYFGEGGVETIATKPLNYAQPTGK